MTTITGPHRVARQQTRGRYPDEAGYVERDGVRVFWECFGEGDPTILFLPTWSIAHSRVWKCQTPYFARCGKVVTFDGRGNGRSDRPSAPEAYTTEQFVGDALAVMDATRTERAWIVSLSMGAPRALMLGADHADRVEGLVFIGAAVPLGPLSARANALAWFGEHRETYDGWEKYNRRYWLEHYEDFVQFFVDQIFTEPHSTKQIEDGVAWGLETDAKTLIATALAPPLDEAAVRELGKRIDKPALVIHGTDDQVRSHGSGAALAELLHAPLVSLTGCGHGAPVRQPVKVNLILRDFIRPRRARTSAWTRAMARAPPCAVHLLPDRPGSRAAGCGDRQRAAKARTGPRDRLARPGPGDAGAGSGGGADPPGECRARERVWALRIRVGRARSALLPGVASHG